MSTDPIPVIGGPLHGENRAVHSLTFRHTTLTTTGHVDHVYRLEQYARGDRSVRFWVHPSASDRQIDHALGLADI